MRQSSCAYEPVYNLRTKVATKQSDQISAFYYIRSRFF